jgi:DNA excision repair protein ERCC-2
MTSLFPHETVRAGQDLLIKDLETCFKEGKILLAHAPTGLGKTASALTVAVQEAISKKKVVFFLTNRHTQHQIAVNTLKLIREKTGESIPCADIIGKRWMCNQEVAGLFGNEFNEFCKAVVEKGECEFYNKVIQKKSLTVEAKAGVAELERQGPLHTDEVISFGKEKGMCSYELSLALAKKAKVIIGDYYYLFNPHVANALFNKLEIELEDVILVVDEGHNLPNRITEMLSNNLTSYMIKNSILEAKKYGYKGMIFWLQELMKVVTDLAEWEEHEFSKERLVEKNEFVGAVKKIVDYDEFIEELELSADEIRKKQRKSYLGGIASFLDAWKGDDDGYTRIISERKGKQEEVIMLSHSCLDPAIVTKDIFSRVHAGVIMSGTLKPTFMYKDVLGIKNGMDKEYGSPFPPENKLTLIIPETSTKYNLRNDAMFRNIADKCSKLASLIPGNVAFFFPSYDLRDKIAYSIKTPKKTFWEKSSMSKDEKDAFLQQFRDASKEGGVLLGVTGANFAEGVDLPGDFLQGVVVVGIPLAKPNLKTKEIIKYYEEGFQRGWDYGYIYPAINKCLQSAGRCIRSETDKGVVIYLDERFAWQNYYCCFPSEGLIVSKDYEKLVGEFF